LSSSKGRDMTLSYFSCLSFEGSTSPRQWSNRL